MCWEMDYKFFAEEKKAQDRTKQERRAGVIGQLLNEANSAGERGKIEETPVTETAPAK